MVMQLRETNQRNPFHWMKGSTSDSQVPAYKCVRDKVARRYETQQVTKRKNVNKSETYEFLPLNPLVQCLDPAQ